MIDKVISIFVSINGKVYKVNPSKPELQIIYDNSSSFFVSCDIHRDGRLSICDLVNGKVVAMNPDGTGKTDIVTNLPGADSITFDLVIISFFFDQIY